jgi:hypothetical protein
LNNNKEELRRASASSLSGKNLLLLFNWRNSKFQ